MIVCQHKVPGQHVFIPIYAVPPMAASEIVYHGPPIPWVQFSEMNFSVGEPDGREAGRKMFDIVFKLPKVKNNARDRERFRTRSRMRRIPYGPI